MSVDQVSRASVWVDRRERVATRASWVFLVLGVLLGASILAAGERETSYDDLSVALADHQVDELTVEGSLQSGVVHWRDGVVRRVTETDGHPVLEPGPGVDVVVVDYSSGHAEIGGWRLPSWTILLMLTVQIGTLWVICFGPRPWRATRWAWFWALWVLPPVGALAFLLLGGSTVRWRPRQVDRRLTAGWAFLLLLAVKAF